MYKQITLPYGFEALEPHIDTLTMQTHYLKHHAAYTKNLNDAAEQAGISGRPIEEVLSRLADIPQAVRTVVRNNGGGFYNHNLYFDHLAPASDLRPTGALLERIEATFGGFADFKEQIGKAALGQFGSGWAWLAADGAGALKIMATPNQDNPLTETGGAWRPIFGIDVWEHAYYLKYKNLRGDYVKALFEVVDWAKVARNYQGKR
ncbi:MAG: superoxide dismutase [Christensenellaceae bacterium]|nr:superoxide dismutase [Christensenellaceae bacterium]